MRCGKCGKTLVKIGGERGGNRRIIIPNKCHQPSVSINIAFELDPAALNVRGNLLPKGVTLSYDAANHKACQ